MEEHTFTPDKIRVRVSDSGFEPKPTILEPKFEFVEPGNPNLSGLKIIFF